MSVRMPVLLPVDLWALGAVIALSVGLMVMLLLEWAPVRPGSPRGAILSLLTLAAAAGSVLYVRDVARSLFGGMFVHDGFTVFFTILFCAVAALAVLLSWDYARRTRIGQSEYYMLLLSATLGMILMAASNDLITIFLGLELMSLALYVLVGIRRARLESNEAALKYFLLGAFASGFLLYGIALLYGATGSTNLTRMAEFLAASPLQNNPLLIVGGLLLLTGFAFKIAAVPFHMWTPDAYEGAPTSVTAFMSAGAKAAGFAALLRVVLHALGGVHANWAPMLSAIAMLTMTVGNVTALLQINLKRMLAYSSIAHAGYLLVAVVAGGHEGASAALFYLAVYSVMNLGAFGVLTLLGRGQEERVTLSDVAGLGFRHPLLGVTLTVFMLSLGGIPPTAGFMAKVYLFGVALKAGWIPLVIVGVLNSVVSVFYYLRVTVAMYMEEPALEPVGISWAAPGVIALMVCLALTLWWGVQAHALLALALRSVQGLM
ncbi:MAG: NADH-quinone oxidoreductase subunit N [Candidatus Eisenbacteria bacterium]|nr:NADH-quinone oxidoreductase subunit N [Candidatus Eisenbacteria bacterium]